MSELTPVAIENHIRELSNRIGKSAGVCNRLYSDFLTADREYDRAYSLAFLNHDGPQTEKRHGAEVATFDERERRDVADAAYRHADRLSRSLQDELRAFQSLNKSLLAQYQVAGTGER